MAVVWDLDIIEISQIFMWSWEIYHFLYLFLLCIFSYRREKENDPKQENELTNFLYLEFLLFKI